MTGQYPPPEPTEGFGAIPVDDPVVTALRGALAREAARVTPSPDGLSRIRDTIQDRDTRSGVRWLPLLAAAAATAVVIGGLAAADRLSWHRVLPVGGAQHSTVGSTVPKLPVYYPAAQGAGYGLFREFHPTAATQPAARVQAAVTAALSAPPDDPDYRLVWASGAEAVASLEPATPQQPGLIRVALNAAAAGTQLTGRLGSIAVQQLVYTASAAAATGPGAQARQNLPVVITVPGGADRLFGVSLTGPLRQTAGPGDPRAHVWIRTLAEHAQVGRGTLRVVGEGVQTGIPLSWTLTRGGGIAREGTVVPLAPDGRRLVAGARGDWRLTLDVSAPGAYTLTVAQPADGGSGVVTWQDSKDFTVG